MRQAGSSMRVVIAGDTSARATELGRRLTEHGGIDVVGLAVNAREALDLVETLVPEAVLVELAKSMGPDAIAAIRRLGPRVIVVSDGRDAGALGADGVVALSDLADGFYTAAALALELGPES